MKVTCPQCATDYQISNDKVPEKGIHGRCRICGTRFFITRPLLRPPTPVSPSTEPAPPASSSKGLRPEPVDQAEKWLRDRSGSDYQLSDQQSSAISPALPSGPLSGTPGIPMESVLEPFWRRTKPVREKPLSPPQPVADDETESAPMLVLEESGTRLGHGIIVALVLLVLTVVIYFALSPVPPPLPKSARYISRPLSPEETAAREKSARESDLLAIRRQIIQKNYTSYSIELMSPEYRSAFYFLDKCGLDCTAVFMTTITPLPDRTGFVMEVFCDQGKNYRLTYLWTTDTVSINGVACS